MGNGCLGQKGAQIWRTKCNLSAQPHKILTKTRYKSMASSIASTVGVSNLPPDAVIFGLGPAMAELRRKVEKLALAAVPLLIQGESGTGKEIICRFIHNRSPWNDGPYVKVNCPAIPGTLLESEL